MGYKKKSEYSLSIDKVNYLITVKLWERLNSNSKQ